MIKTINWMLSRRIFYLRSAVFAAALILTLISMDLAASVFYLDLFAGIKTFHLLWGLLMFEMVLALIPGLSHFIGRGKVYGYNFIRLEHDPKTLLNEYAADNWRAVLAGLVWIVALVGLGYFRVGRYWFIMSSIFFYFLDQLFVNVWCPFQSWILRCRCCATCRIYSWGFPIIVSPLIYIKSFWTYSLVAMGALIFLQWEYLHYRFPERFSVHSNGALNCNHCNDRCIQGKYAC